jgi:hypothetical protein
MEVKMGKMEGPKIQKSALNPEKSRFRTDFLTVI